MTDPKSLGRFAHPPTSDTVITDGDWHRIGLVWDGTYRTLYVDDVESAKDVRTPGVLQGADGGLSLVLGKVLSQAASGPA